MRFFCLIATLWLATSALAAPPPNADGRFRDWFHSLTVPGTSTPCCTVADCRMVDSRWDDQAQHYQARVIREEFSDALRSSPLYQYDTDAFRNAQRVWLRKWITVYGDVAETWIEIPEAKVNPAYNPTGRAVLCWSTFYPDFNGVFCFVPYLGV